MMYPALRGGSANPGFKEGLYGEVDDVIAAAEYAAKLDYVNTNRIYLGGHSTGGTLVLLAAEYTNRFRAVFSFGPAGSVADYGLKELPFDVRNRKEAALRAPRAFLSDIRTQTFVMEGTEGNREDLEDMRRISKNPAIKFILVPKIDHFGILQPASKVIAEKILSDSSSKSRFELNADQILGAFQR